MLPKLLLDLQVLEKSGIATTQGNHCFRAIGIDTYPKDGENLGKVVIMVNHSSTRTTKVNLGQIAY
jgi:hypothetical protein